MKIRKTESCPKFFHRDYSFEIVVTDDHFINQKSVLMGNKSCLNTFRGLKFCQRGAKCEHGNMALPFILNITAVDFSIKQ